MIVCKPVLWEVSSKIVINTDLKVIEQVNKLKALGMYVTSGLSNYANINNIISKVNLGYLFLRRFSSFHREELNWF